MRFNPFESSKPASRPLVEVARTVSGRATAKLMRRLESRGGKRVGTKKPVENFALTTDEQVALQEAQRFEPLLQSEHQRLLAFFGESFNIPPLPSEITPELKEFWEQNGFVLEYWPKVEMSEDKEYPGWMHKPGERYADGNGIEFFDEVEAIQDLPENKSNPNLKNLSPLDLPGCWVLKDTRAKPNYDNGKQVYDNDTLFKEALGARNNKHPKEFNKPDFWTPLSKALKLDTIPGAILRLPRIIEANVMGQGEGFHDTDTYEWCEEFYRSGGRLISGRSDRGGASGVRWFDNADGNLGCRPLVVFPSTQI